MNRLVIVSILFVLSGVVNFSSSAMELNQKHRAYEHRCEGCGIGFTIAKSRISHIIHIHYTCPWCNDLKFIDRGSWKTILPEDRQARIDHIKKCARKQRNPSLWACQKCFALFYNADKNHVCGPRHQINLITNQLLDSEVVAKFENKTTCNQCSSPTKFAGVIAYKNHIIRQHLTCPWCLVQYTNIPNFFAELRQNFFLNHLMKCAELYNESLFVCKTCFGVKLSRRCVHIDSSCPGKEFQICKKNRITRNIELIEGLDLLNQVEMDKTLLSILFDENHKLKNIKSYLESNFSNNNELQVFNE